eukprot:326150-Chlamydomonas_euryale.AAC.4
MRFQASPFSPASFARTNGVACSCPSSSSTFRERSRGSPSSRPVQPRSPNPHTRTLPSHNTPARRCWLPPEVRGTSSNGQRDTTSPACANAVDRGNAARGRSRAESRRFRTIRAPCPERPRRLVGWRATRAAVELTEQWQVALRRGSALRFGDASLTAAEWRSSGGRF